MTFRKFSVSTVLSLLLSAGMAFAWPSCKGNWVQVPSGTSSANGAIYTTSDNLTFQCQTTPPSNSGPTSSTSNSSSTSSSNSNSGATATATGGNSNSTATGGKSSSTSGVNNSGNSSNSNTNKLTNSGNSHSSSSSGVSNAGNSTATGGAATGGNANQQQSQQQNAQNSGNNSDYNSETNIAAPKIPVDTAYAPFVGPTVPCFKGVGFGVQSVPLGASFGGGKIDGNCAILEAARQAPSRIARCKVYISNKYVKAAGVTLEDCLNAFGDPQPVIVQPPSPVSIVLPSANATANVAPPVAAVEVPEYKTEVNVTPEGTRLLGICTFAKAISCQPDSGPAIVSVSSICKRMLDSAKNELQRNPNAILYVIGNRNHAESEVTATTRAYNVKKYLEAAGIKSGKIKVSTGSGTDRTVELWSETK